MLSIWIDPDTDLRLTRIASELRRDKRELAGAAVMEAALNHFRNRNDDPVKEKQP